MLRFFFTVLLLFSVASLRAESERLLLAEGFYRRNMFDLAAPEYKAALAEPELPGNQKPAILYRLAECQRRTGRIPEAKETYISLVKAYPADENAHRARLQLALFMLEAGQTPQALKLLEALRADYIPAEIRDAAAYHLAATFEQTGNDEEAIRRYEAIAGEKSDYAEYASMRLAWLCSRKADPENIRKATGIYHHIALNSKDPNRIAQALAAAAQLAYAGNHWDESATLFLRLREQSPDLLLTENLSLPAAWACYRSGRMAQAQSIAETALAAPDPKLPDQLLYLIANTARSLAQTTQAHTAYTRLIKTCPQSPFAPAAHYEQLLLLYSEGRYADFLTLAKTFENPPPESADRLLRMQLEAATQLDRTDDAVSFASRLIQTHPDSPLAPDAAYRLAWLYQKQEKWELAADAYRNLATRWPQSPEAAKACYAAAICMSRAQKPDAMLQELATLLTRYPDDPLAPDALLLKAREEIAAARYPIAAATLDELIRRFPQSPHIPQALFWRGTLFRQTQDFGSAQDYLDRAIRAGLPRETEIEAQLQRGHALQQLKRDQEAAALLQPLIDLKTHEKIDTPKLRWLTEFQMQTQNWPLALKAAQAFHAAAQTPADRQLALLYLARVNTALDQKATAIESLRQAQALARTTPTAAAGEIGLRLGELYAQAGDDASAKDAFTWSAAQASTPAQRTIRARAIEALALIAQRQNRLEDALRLNMSLIILYDNDALIPPAISRSIALLDTLNRPDERRELIAELIARYPQSTEAQAWAVKPPPAQP